MGLRNDKDINLYKALKSIKTKNSNKPGRIRWIVPPVLIVLLLGGAFAYFYMQNVKLQNQADKINAYINNEETIKKYNESQELQNLQQQYNNEKKRLEIFEKAINTYPELNKEIFEKIEESTKNKIIVYDISYTGTNGLMQMEATALDIGAASEFTQNLLATGLFEKVNYKGWSLGSNNRYTFNVICVLKAEEQEVQS